MLKSLMFLYRIKHVVHASEVVALGLNTKNSHSPKNMHIDHYKFTPLLTQLQLPVQNSKHIDKMTVNFHAKLTRYKIWTCTRFYCDTIILFYSRVNVNFLRQIVVVFETRAIKISLTYQFEIFRA